MAAYFWVGGTGTWSGTGNTQFAVTSGGTPTALNPTNADTVTFDANSGTAATVTVTSTAVSLSTTINKSDITLSLSGSPTLCTAAGTCTLTTGTLNLAGFVLTTGIFSSSNANVRTITTGAGSFTVTGNATTVWSTGNPTNLTYTSGIPTVNATYSGSVGTRIFNIGGTADRINLNITAGSDIIAPVSTFIVNNYNFTGFSGTLTNVASIIFGSLTLSSTMTVSAGANLFEFRATSGTTPITSAGKTMDFPITFNGNGTVFQLQDALTSGVTRTVTLNAGILSLVSYTLTSGVFVCGSSTGNTLDFATGNIVLSGTGTIFTGSTATTVTGTPQVICTDNSATARTLTPGVVTETNSISFRITAGTGTLDITAGAVRNLDFTDGTNPTGYAGQFGSGVITVYGNLKASTGMTQLSTSNAITFAATSGIKTITTAAVVFDRPFTFNGVGGTWQLQDALTSGSTRACTLTNGTLDLNGYTLTTGSFNSSNTNTRTVTSGAGSFTLTGNNATLWQTGVSTNLTYTTIPTVNATYSGATGTRTFSVDGAVDRINLNITAGTDTISNTPTFPVNNYNFTGFAGTLANTATNIFGNLTLSTGMTVSAGGNAFTFTATSGTKTITSNGKTMDFPVTFNGIGGTFQLQDALTLGSTRTLTLTNGTLQSGGYLITSSTFTSTGSGTRSLALSAGSISVTGTGTVWTGSGTNFSMGTTDVILLNSASAQTFSGGGLTYGVLSIGNANIKTITGSSTFNNIVNTVSPASVTFAASSTNTFSNFNLNGTSGNLVTLRSTVPGTQYTLVKV